MKTFFFPQAAVSAKASENCGLDAYSRGNEDYHWNLTLHKKEEKSGFVF